MKKINYVPKISRACSGFFPIMQLTLILLLVAALNVSANETYSESEMLQPRKISGTVTERDGTGLPGASVTVAGTTIGTVTNPFGGFELSIPADAGQLVISFVGMETVRVEISASDVYNIVLIPSAVNLDEIVVVGYGVVRRSDLTGSVSRIESSRIAQMAPTQITEALSGTVAGLYSTQGASAAGGGSLEIRGPSSLAATTEPLIVLDGVIYPGSMRDINPNDIESIDILRDASSSAIFGSRAAAGVILITTKRGVIGKPTIDFSSTVGLSSTANDFYPLGMAPGADPMDYFNMHRDLLTENARAGRPYGFFFHPDQLPGNVSVEEWMSWVDNPRATPLEEWFARINPYPTERENFLAGRTVNPYDHVIGTGLRQDYSLGVGGATENLRYYWSVGYLDNEGVIKGDKFSAIRTRLNLDLDVNSWFKVGTNSQFTNRDESVNQAQLAFVQQASPYGTLYNEDGSPRMYPHDYTAVRHPLEDFYGRNRERDINSLFSSLFAEMQLPLGISYRVSYQPQLAFTKDFNFWSTDTATGRDAGGGTGRREQWVSYGWMVDNLLKWDQTFGAHRFDVTLLANAERNRSWYSRQDNRGFSPNQNLGYNALQFGSSPSLTNNDTEESGDALMARLNYSLLGKYLFTGSVRRDGYSAFGQDKPRATFPSVALAWQISEEGFYNPTWMVNRLKLRLSWGENGNRAIGAYSALARIGSVLHWGGSGVQTGVFNTSLANPALRWERTESYNIGLDMGLFNNRVDITLDAYDATTTDLLLNRQLPRITGFNSVTSNLGALGNRGLEATVNSININQQNFQWRSTIVYSMNRNKIKELWGDYGNYTLLGVDRYGELPDFQNQWFPGYARDIIWDYERIGIWQLDERAAAAVYGLEPGDYKVTDVNEDGRLTQFEDKKFIGYTAPRHRWGFRNEFTVYRNLSASFFIRADLGHVRQVPNTGNRSVHDRTNDWSWDYWSPENPGAMFQRNVYPDNLGRYGGNIRPFAPTGFVRLQDASLSYNVPANHIQRFQLQSLRVMLSMRNLLTFTNWPGFDPESSMTPMPKTFTFGLDLTL
jgi:TonB-dependent starch-binding outer membrane protein SusC